MSTSDSKLEDPEAFLEQLLVKLTVEHKDLTFMPMDYTGTPGHAFNLYLKDDFSQKWFQNLEEKSDVISAKDFVAQWKIDNPKGIIKFADTNYPSNPKPFIFGGPAYFAVQNNDGKAGFVSVNTGKTESIAEEKSKDDLLKCNLYTHKALFDGRHTSVNDIAPPLRIYV